MPKGQTPQDFQSYLNKFRRAGGIVKSVLNLSIVSIPVYYYGPEHERRVFDVTISALLAVAVTFVAFVLLSGTARKKLLRALLFSFGASLLFALAYLAFYSYCTGRDSSGDRYIKGMSYTPQILEYKNGMAQKRLEGQPVVEITEDDDLVANYHNDPRKIWVASTVDLMGGLVRLFGLLPLVASVVWFISCVMLLIPAMSSQATAASSDSSQPEQAGRSEALP